MSAGPRSQSPLLPQPQSPSPAPASVARPQAQSPSPAQAGPVNGSAIAVDPSTVHEQVEVAARRMDARPHSPSAGSSQTDADAEDEATFQLWEDKRHMASYLMSSMQQDSDSMLVLEFTAENKSYMRPGLSRFDLLRECRKSVPDSALGPVQQRRHYRGAMLQLRDIRALQVAHRPSLMVRIGAIVVSIDPLNAIITHDRAFVMVPDGADSLLAPLLKRVGHGHSDAHTQNTAFEFVALESLLMTLVSHHQQEVKRSVPGGAGAVSAVSCACMRACSRAYASGQSQLPWT